MTSEKNDRTFWDRYAGIYDILLVLKAYRMLMADMLKAAEIVPGMRVADFGCGTGNFLLTLYQTFGNAIRGFGFDRSTAMLEHAQEKLIGSNYSFEQLDLSQNVDLEERFHCILCSQVLYALPDPDTAIRMLKRHLHQDGKMILVNPDAGQFMGLILMAQLDQSPKDVERWRTNDLAKLNQLSRELFGNASVAEIAMSVTEHEYARMLRGFQDQPVTEILSKLGEINVEIVRRAQEEKTYHFTTNQQLKESLIKAGCSISYEALTYGNQCHMMVAQPV
ncbi:class I SAM-dependent methyltransferase [Patescibacteria group bacterium]